MPHIEKEIKGLDVGGVNVPIIEVNLATTEPFDIDLFDKLIESYRDYWGAGSCFRFIVGNNTMYIAPQATRPEINRRLNDKTFSEALNLSDKLQCAGTIVYQTGEKRKIRSYSSILEDSAMLTANDSEKYAIEKLAPILKDYFDIK